MSTIKNPFISKVTIKNFRNFLDTEVQLGHKQVIIGENNVGKTNFLRAIQLILDQSFSDNDRTLLESDFHDTLDAPMVNGEEIEISIEIKGYEHNSKLIAQFADAVISDTPPTLKLTYVYKPTKDHEGNIIRYDYLIYKGNKDDCRFTNEDRGYINIYVIKALRDVERELKANKQSPLYKLVKKYEISQEDLQEISDALKDAAHEILDLDEIVHIKNTLQERFTSLSGLQKDNQITLRTFDIDTERLLYNLQVYMGMKERPISELSLGLANILYVSLMLILIKDRTVLPIIKPDKFNELLKIDDNGLLKQLYQESDNGNFILKSDISNDNLRGLYTFMDENNYRPQSFTILAVEEPEAHLHPVLQRLLYREILHKSTTSVVFTSHSTFIASVAPLHSIVHIRQIGNASEAFSTIGLAITNREKKDIERYIDAKRGEIYFGKGIILTEGITEEYIVPRAAEISATPLDDYGIIVCNVNSTNFKPYVQLLDILSIPWVIFTDGDYYEISSTEDPDTGEITEERTYHILGNDGHFRGDNNIGSLLVDLGYIEKDDIPESYSDQDELFKEYGCFIGYYTLEVDMMNSGDKDVKTAFKAAYGELITGGKKMKENFDDAIDSGQYWEALKKIENNISKGRFAQRFTSHLTSGMIPAYVSEGIASIIEKVSGNE